MCLVFADIAAIVNSFADDVMHWIVNEAIVASAAVVPDVDSVVAVTANVTACVADWIDSLDY